LRDFIARHVPLSVSEGAILLPHFDAIAVFHFPAFARFILIAEEAEAYGAVLPQRYPMCMIRWMQHHSKEQFAGYAV
jgi:hypothetical protein